MTDTKLTQLTHTKAYYENRAHCIFHWKLTKRLGNTAALQLIFYMLQTVWGKITSDESLPRNLRSLIYAAHRRISAAVKISVPLSISMDYHSKP